MLGTSVNAQGTMSAVSTNLMLRRSSARILAALVAVLSVASYVVVNGNTRRILRALALTPTEAHNSAFRLAGDMATSAAYAVILLAWGRSTTSRIAAAVLALGAGFAKWALTSAWIYSAFRGRFDEAPYYAYLLVPATLAALAWGVARRRGRLWLWAVPIAPALLGLQLWLFFHEMWWVDFQGGHGISLDYALVLGPIVIACFAGWALDTDRKAARRAALSSEPLAEVERSA
jgi:hypothetical protein